MPTAEGFAGWAARFDELSARLAPRFGRQDIRRRGQAYLRGLLGHGAVFAEVEERLRVEAECGGKQQPTRHR